MKYANQFVMHIVCTDVKRGNRWLDRITVDATNLDDAKVAATMACDKMNKARENIKCEPRGTGYRLTIGGGCRW